MPGSTCTIWSRSVSNRQGLSNWKSAVTTSLADSARRVLDRVRAEARGVDPERQLVGDEAVVRVILGDHDEAVRLIKEYLTVHPDHRSGFATGTVWWWRDLQSHPEFRRLVQA